MFDGVLVLGVPELVLMLVATGVAGAFLYIAVKSTWNKKTHKLEDCSYGSYGPAFIVDEGQITEKNTSARDSEIADRLQVLAIEAADSMDSGFESGSTVSVGNKKFTVRGIRLSASGLLVFFDQIGPQRGYFGDILEKMEHEIRSSVDVVLGQSSLLEEDAKRGQAKDDVETYGIEVYLDRVRTTARTINRRGRTIQQWIKRANQLSKLQDPATVEWLDFKHLSMKDIVHGCVQTAEYKHQIYISQQVPNNLPDVNGNEGFLQLAVDNLLENAVKHGGNSKEIVVKLSHGEIEDHVTCRVIDKGVGIPAEKLEDIFVIGVKLDPSKEGMGFGLSEVKSTVEGLHKGRLEVESTVGQGTTFIMHLPCAD